LDARQQAVREMHTCVSIRDHLASSTEIEECPWATGTAAGARELGRTARLRRGDSIGGGVAAAADPDCNTPITVIPRDSGGLAVGSAGNCAELLSLLLPLAAAPDPLLSSATGPVGSVRTEAVSGGSQQTELEGNTVATEAEEELGEAGDDSRAGSSSAMHA